MATVVASRNCSLTTSALRLSSRTLAISSKGLNHNATRRTLQRSITLGRPTSVFQQEQSLPSLSNAPTTRTASTSANSSTTPTPTASPSNQATLTWDEFLKLRRTRRYVNLGASLFSGVGAIAVATPLIAEYEIENVGAQMTGLDPMFVIGGSLMAVGGVGWLMGPFLGTAFFKVWKSSVASEFARKEKGFYAHIKQYRADPASSSVNNPVPDYYGEKIGSVADYRRWLKDQRAFNRKKNKNMI